MIFVTRLRRVGVKTKTAIYPELLFDCAIGRRSYYEIMFVHIVAWKYKDETGNELRDLHRTRLRQLPELIPDIVSFEVGADILHLERSYDTGLVARYKNREAFDQYTVHEAHQAVARMGKEIAEHVISVDFSIGDSV